MLRIECGCGKTLKVADEAAGKKVKCPSCGQLTLIKKPAETAASAGFLMRVNWPQEGHLTFLPAASSATLRVLPQPHSMRSMRYRSLIQGHFWPLSVPPS